MKLDMQLFDYERDFGMVYRLFSDRKTSHLIINRPNQNDVRSFDRWLQESLGSSINDFFVFFDEKVFAGFAYSYDFSLVDGLCCFTVAVDNEYRGTGAGAFIAAQFISYLFKTYPLRKVYARVISDNESSVSSLEAAGACREGLLKEYRYQEGEYKDMAIYAILRNQFISARCLGIE